jgi:hypothetical protein
LRTTAVEPTPITVISGLSEFKENSALQMRDASSGQRTVTDSVEADTVIGPGRTPEMSAGTMAATLRMGMKRIRHRIRLGSGRLYLIPAMNLSSGCGCSLKSLPGYL